MAFPPTVSTRKRLGLAGAVAVLLGANVLVAHQIDPLPDGHKAKTDISRTTTSKTPATSKTTNHGNGSNKR